MSISIGNKIELVKLEQVIKNDKNRKVYASKIYDMITDSKLQIAMPIYDGKIVPLAVDEKYSACFYTTKGLLQCNVVVTSRYKSGNLFFLEVLLLGEPTKVQRREFYRYKCSIPAEIRLVSEREYETGMLDKPDVTEDELEWMQAKLLDLSGGGVKLVQKNNIDKNEVVKIKFEVSMVGEILRFDLYARILSSTIMNNQTSLYMQRLEFMKIKQEERDRIVRFIFENERIARAKETRKS